MTNQITLYHGSMRLFDQFSLDYLGENGRAQGTGVYLTTDKHLALMYATKHQQTGYFYMVNAALENALSAEKRTITITMLKKILDVLHRTETEIDPLSNFGDIDWLGYPKVKNDAVQILHQNLNDLDLYNELVNVTGDADIVSQAFYDVGRFTHCIVEQQTRLKSRVYVVLHPRYLTIERSAEFNAIV